jgi:hypothetical protein
MIALHCERAAAGLVKVDMFSQLSCPKPADVPFMDFPMTKIYTGSLASD